MMRKCGSMLLSVLIVCMCVTGLTAIGGITVFAQERTAEEVVAQLQQKTAQDMGMRPEQTKISEYAQLYTSINEVQMTEKIHQMQAQKSPSLQNLDDISSSSAGRVIAVSYNGILDSYYLMQQNTSGEWENLAVFSRDELALEREMKKYTARTNVKKPALYFNCKEQSGIEQVHYIFDDSTESCLVMDESGNFYRSDELAANWFSYWNAEIGRQPYTALKQDGMDSMFGIRELKKEHPKVWMDILAICMLAVALILVFYVVIWIVIRCKKEAAPAWFEKIPLAHRMMSGMARYTK